MAVIAIAPSAISGHLLVVQSAVWLDTNEFLARCCRSGPLSGLGSDRASKILPLPMAGQRQSPTVPHRLAATPQSTARARLNGIHGSRGSILSALLPQAAMVSQSQKELLKKPSFQGPQ